MKRDYRPLVFLCVLIYSVGIVVLGAFLTRWAEQYSYWYVILVTLGLFAVIVIIGPIWDYARDNAERRWLSEQSESQD